MTTIIEVEMADGRVFHGRADFGKGSPANPMTDAELADKFRQCATWGRLAPDRIEAALDILWNLEKLKDVKELTRLLH